MVKLPQAQKGIDNAKAKNRTITKLTPEQLAQWDALIAPIADEWVKTAQSKGMANAADLLKDLRALRAAAMK